MVGWELGADKLFLEDVVAMCRSVLNRFCVFEECLAPVAAGVRLVRAGAG
jgi:hypothetical protein